MGRVDPSDDTAEAGGPATVATVLKSPEHLVRLLAIDNNPDTLLACRQELAQHGFFLQTRSVLHVPTFPTTPPTCDLLLLDLHTIIPDYFDALRHMRAHAPDLPLVLLVERDTAHEPATLTALALAAGLGVHSLLFKPFDFAELQRTLHAAYQHERIRRMHRQLARLGPAGMAAAGTSAARQHNERLIQLVLTEIGGEWATLERWYPDEDTLYVVACAIEPGTTCPLLPVGHSIPLLGTSSGWALRNRRSLLISSHPDGQRVPPELRSFFADNATLSMLSVPLLEAKQPLGVISIATTQRALHSDDQVLLLLLAEYIARAWAQAAPTGAASHPAHPLAAPPVDTLAQAMVSHVPGALWLLDDAAQHILDANHAAEQLSGYSCAALRDLAPTTLFSCLTGGECESLLFTRDKQQIPVALSVSRFAYEGQYLRLLLVRDLRSERARAQQAAQSEKLAAIGRLVSGIAHEINNPLQALHNTLHLLITRAANGDDVRRQRYLTMAQLEVDHLIEVVRRVLDIYRPASDGMRPVDIHEALHTVMTAMSTRLHNNGIRIVYIPTPGLPHTLGINGHLKQVYEALILNAIDSMPDGGTLTIRTYATVAEPLISSDADSGIMIEFSDTGHGIPPDDLAKVFEPFYTTRSSSSGLSLAISYGIVEQHQGKLSVHSEVGHGTTFCLHLPAVQ
jgi:two-component system NtrC family sensor kinase